MTKFYKSLTCALAMAAFSLPAFAEVTITGPLYTTKAPGSVWNNDGDNYAWMISSFSYGFSNPENETIGYAGASATFQYVVGKATTPMAAKGTVTISTSPDEIRVTTSSEDSIKEFLTQGLNEGASKWQILISGITAGDQPLVSGCDGVKVAGNTIVITYYYNVDAMENDTDDDEDAGNYDPTVPYPIEEGMKFTLLKGQYGFYTPAQTGIMTLTCQGHLFVNPVFESLEALDAFVNPVYPTSGPDFSNLDVSNGTWTYKVTGGHTYYFGFGNGDTPISPLTVTFTEGSDQNPDTTPSNTLTWGEASPVMAGEYTITPEVGGQAYIQTNKNEDLSSVLTLYYGDPSGEEVITLTAIPAAEGYAYNINYMAEGVEYTLVVAEDAPEGLEVTFLSGTATSLPQEITTLNEAVSVAAQVVYYYKATQDATLNIATNAGEENFDSGSFVYTDESLENKIVVNNTSENGIYACSFPVTEGETYYFYFTSPDSMDITLTLGETAEEKPDYMAMPSFYQQEDTIFFIWNETINEVNEEEDLTGTLTTPDGQEATVTFNITTMYVEAEDEPSIEGSTSQYASDNALMLDMTPYVSDYGYGTYKLSFGSIVRNENGEVNAPIEDEEFTISEPTEPTDIEPQISISANAIIITWDNEALKYNNPGKDDIQILVNDPLEGEDVRLNNDNGVTIEENALVISIENLNLIEGEKYTLIVPANYVLVGEDELGNALIETTFVAQSTGIEALESNLSNVEGIYNLQGVKVQNPVKGQIYIINGKKVIIK